jgi:hypothetical protein
LHDINTIYHRRCELSLSGVTSAYKRRQKPLAEARDRLESKANRPYCGVRATDVNDRITV